MSSAVLNRSTLSRVLDHYNSIKSQRVSNDPFVSIKTNKKGEIEQFVDINKRERFASFQVNVEGNNKNEDKDNTDNTHNNTTNPLDMTSLPSRRRSSPSASLRRSPSSSPPRSSLPLSPSPSSSPRYRPSTSPFTSSVGLTDAEKYARGIWIPPPALTSKGLKLINSPQSFMPSKKLQEKLAHLYHKKREEKQRKQRAEEGEEDNKYFKNFDTQRDLEEFMASTQQRAVNTNQQHRQPQQYQTQQHQPNDRSQTKSLSSRKRTPNKRYPQQLPDNQEDQDEQENDVQDEIPHDDDEYLNDENDEEYNSNWGDEPEQEKEDDQTEETDQGMEKDEEEEYQYDTQRQHPSSKPSEKRANAGRSRLASDAHTAAPLASPLHLSDLDSNEDNYKNSHQHYNTSSRQPIKRSIPATSKSERPSGKSKKSTTNKPSYESMSNQIKELHYTVDKLRNKISSSPPPDHVLPPSSESFAHYHNQLETKGHEIRLLHNKIDEQSMKTQLLQSEKEKLMNKMKELEEFNGQLMNNNKTKGQELQQSLHGLQQSLKQQTIQPSRKRGSLLSLASKLSNIMINGDRQEREDDDDGDSRFSLEKTKKVLLSLLGTLRREYEKQDRETISMLRDLVKKCKDWKGEFRKQRRQWGEDDGEEEEIGEDDNDLGEVKPSKKTKIKGNTTESFAGASQEDFPYGQRFLRKLQRGKTPSVAKQEEKPLYEEEPHVDPHPLDIPYETISISGTNLSVSSPTARKLSSLPHSPFGTNIGISTATTSLASSLPTRVPASLLSSSFGSVSSTMRSTVPFSTSNNIALESSLIGEKKLLDALEQKMRKLRGGEG